MIETRPDTRLPKSRAGGQGPYLRSPDHLGRRSEVKSRESGICNTRSAMLGAPIKGAPYDS